MPPEGNSNTQPTAGGSIPMPGQLETAFPEVSFPPGKVRDKTLILGPQRHEAVTPTSEPGPVLSIFP